MVTPATGDDALQFEPASHGIARITLNRPAQLNSFTESMLIAFREALSVVQSDTHARTLVITGSGRAFSAGQDVNGLSSDNVGYLVETYYNPLVRLLTELRIPVIAQVNGVAAGAAANLALACDLVIAAESARFIQPFRHIGLVPDAGGTWLLPRLAGLPRALGMALTGEPVDAVTAAQWGLIWKTVPDAELAATVEALAADLARAAPMALAFTKQLMRQGLNHEFGAHLALEKDFQAAASQSRDFRVGVEAFLARRKPEFDGT